MAQDRRGAVSNKDPNLNVVSGVTGGGYQNPMGRASVAGPIAPPGAPVEPCLLLAAVFWPCQLPATVFLPSAQLPWQVPQPLSLHSNDARRLSCCHNPVCLRTLVSC